MSKSIITTDQLTKRYGTFQAVNNLSLSITQGAIHGFVGPNGAGKTTTIKMLIGAISVSSGTGMIANHIIGSKESRSMIGYVPERTMFYKDLTTIEFLIYMGRLAGLSEQEAKVRSYQLLTQYGLIAHQFKYPHQFSSGMKKKVMFIQSLLHRPRVLILDEPTANLDPETRLFMMETLSELVKTEGLTVLISSHILTELEKLVDEISLINQGQMVLSGPMSAIKKNFADGHFTIKTNDDDLLKQELLKWQGTTQIFEQAEGLKVQVNNPESLRKIIGELMVKHHLSLYTFVEDHISLDHIYKSVFTGKRGTVDDCV